MLRNYTAVRSSRSGDRAEIEKPKVSKRVWQSIVIWMGGRSTLVLTTEVSNYI